MIEGDGPVVGLVAVEFGDEITDGADGREVEIVDFDPFVVAKFAAVLVDVVDDFIEANSGEGELFGIFEQVGVFVFANY